MQPWQDPEIERIRQEYIQFATENLKGDTQLRDQTGDFSLERWRQVADYGFLKLMMPSGNRRSGGTCNPCRSGY